MKKMLAILFAVTTVMTGCTNKEPEVTEPAIQAYNERITTVATTVPTTVPTTEPTVTVELTETTVEVKAPLVPVIEQNISDKIDLSVMIINGYEVELDDLTYEEFLLITKLAKNPVGATCFDTELFYFNSGMYCLQESGTQISVELVDKDGNLVENGDEENYNANELYVKGIHFDEFWMRGDYEISTFALFGTDTTQETIYTVLGKGVQEGGKHIYRNSTYTMIVEFENRDGTDYVESVTILKN